MELSEICSQSKAEVSLSEKSDTCGIFVIKGTQMQIAEAKKIMFDKIGVVSIFMIKFYF